MIVYIAGPITNDPNYKHKFADAEVRLKGRGHTVMNPTILPEGLTWEQYMEICLPMLAVCDTVYMLLGWDESRGARAEHEHAKKLGKKILYEADEKMWKDPEFVRFAERWRNVQRRAGLIA